MVAFAEWLDCRRIRGDEAAAALDTTPPTISRIRAGAEPKPALAKRIVAWTGGAVSLTDLYGVDAAQSAWRPVKRSERKAA